MCTCAEIPAAFGEVVPASASLATPTVVVLFVLH